MLTVVHDGASPVSADELFETAAEAGALDVVPLTDPPGRTEVQTHHHTHTVSQRLPAPPRPSSIISDLRRMTRGGTWLVWDLQLWCAPADVQRLRLAVEARGLQVEEMDIVYVPHTFAAPLQVTGATGNAKDLPPDSWEAFHSLVTQIDDLDDVIRVNHNHPETPDVL